MMHPGGVNKSFARQDKRSWLVAVEAALLMVAGTFFIPGSADLRMYYLPFASGCLACGVVPYYTRWILYPLSLLPVEWVWTIWTVLTLGGLLLLARVMKVNPAFLMLAFPVVGQFWLGQIDILLCVGVVLAVISPKPFLRGLGLSLLMVKPQIGLLPFLFLVLSEDRKVLWKVLAIPMGMFLLSLLVYGVNWPFEWLQHAQQGIPDHVWKLGSGLLWPWGLILLPLVFFFKTRREGTLAALLISALVFPFFSVYSYIVFLIFDSSLWTMLISYLWVIAMPFLGNTALRYAWILPLFMLLKMIRDRFFPKENLGPLADQGTIR